MISGLRKYRFPRVGARKPVRVLIKQARLDLLTNTSTVKIYSS